MAENEIIHKNRKNIFFQIILILGILTQYFMLENVIQDKTYSVIIYSFFISFVLLNLFLMISRSFAILTPYSKSISRFLRMYKVEDYEEISRETTEKEKEKLFVSEEFAQMMLSKGQDEAEWNWQLRDRRKGKLNVLSDDELSNITVSEDEEEEKEEN